MDFPIVFLQRCLSQSNTKESWIALILSLPLHTYVVPLPQMLSLPCLLKNLPSSFKIQLQMLCSFVKLLWNPPTKVNLSFFYTSM